MGRAQVVVALVTTTTRRTDEDRFNRDSDRADESRITDSRAYRALMLLAEGPPVTRTCGTSVTQVSDFTQPKATSAGWAGVGTGRTQTCAMSARQELPGQASGTAGVWNVVLPRLSARQRGQGVRLMAVSIPESATRGPFD